MAIQTPKSPTQYASEVLGALQATGISNTSPGGKARALADIISSEMGTLEINVFIQSSQNLLPFATGNALDAFGAIFNVPRLSGSDAQSTSTDGNFEFYVLSGTFGDINSGNDIIIPQGTQLFTSSINGPVYTVDTQITLSAGASSVFFSASSVNTGALGNAPVGVFDQSNFTNYTQANFGTLLVTNNFGIVSGSDPETDENYRYRISLRLQSSGGNAEVDIRAALLQVPGIQDVAFNPLAGTYQVYIYGISSVVPPGLLTLSQASMDANTAYPLTGTALAPDLVGISLATTITLQSGLNSIDQSSVVSAAQTAASNYINNLSVGADLVINELATVIINSDTRILDIGNPDDPILEIYIWRSRIDGTRYSQFLINNYIPVLGERILVEQSIQNPINLAISS